MFATAFVYVHAAFWVFVAFCCVRAKFEVAEEDRRAIAAGHLPRPRESDILPEIISVAMLIFSAISCYQVS